jgi:hypothetical protein
LDAEAIKVVYGAGSKFSKTRYISFGVAVQVNFTDQIQMCWPEALNQIGISDIAFLIRLNKHLLSSDLVYSAQMGSLSFLIWGSFSTQMGVNQTLADGYVANSRSIYVRLMRDDVLISI